MLFRDNINQMKFLGDETFVLKVDTKYLKNEICFKVISATLFTASPIKSVVRITIFSPLVLVSMNVTMTLQIFFTDHQIFLPGSTVTWRAAALRPVVWAPPLPCTPPPSWSTSPLRSSSWPATPPRISRWRGSPPDISSWPSEVRCH